MGIIKTIINNHPGSAAVDMFMTDESKIIDCKEIAMLFNGYFSGVDGSLEEKIPQGNKQIENCMTIPLPNVYVLLRLAPTEVIDLAKAAKTTRSQ